VLLLKLLLLLLTSRGSRQSWRRRRSCRTRQVDGSYNGCVRRAEASLDRQRAQIAEAHI
jgi:hypothetical protein